MALNFPNNPIDGQLYPDPPIPGAQQYTYNATKGTWLTVTNTIQSVSGQAPIFIDGPPRDPIVAIRPATVTQSGSMSAEDKRKVESIPPSGAGSVTRVTAGIGIGAPGANQTITTTGTINLLPATDISLGGVQPGAGTQVSSQGVISLTPPRNNGLGGVKAGKGITIDPDGTINTVSTGFFIVLDTLAPQFNGAQLSFTMTVSGVPYTPNSTSSLLIFVGGVVQAAPTNFTTNGSLILFTTAPPAGATFYGVSLE
jgi:hypothetical protein